MSRLPLEQFEVFHTDNLDLARETVGKVLCPHKLSLVGRDGALDAHLHSRRLHNIGLTYAAYGGEPGNFYVVEVALAGKGVIRSGNRQTQLMPGRAAAVGPAEPLTQRLSASFGHLVLRIERTALEVQLSNLPGTPLARPLDFRLGMDLVAGYARRWYDLARYWVADVDRRGSMLNHHSLLMESVDANS
ncbi:cupin domain-containing protein [Amycolatopsis alkalitolerans]|uniref:Transcription regulator HTH AraC- type ligand binding domain-containing protein n=1 Tax=Amycolatopsis alkalitolerans TaxID=2547244 RepID=A0A5C4M1B4_9PSEU|nr:hypothetical protein [Amycolatopsis alkalitolerans]TNC26409.1 hypothetical protein FG385_11675 [Amycolatopsis alkalitolerans]